MRTAMLTVLWIALAVATIIGGLIAWDCFKTLRDHNPQALRAIPGAILIFGFTLCGVIGGHTSKHEGGTK